MLLNFKGLASFAALALTAVVRQQSTPPNPPHLDLLKVGESGSKEGGPAYSAIVDVAAGAGGDVYVLDVAEPYLRILSRGRIRKEWGREGAGPGEFGGPASLGWRGDTLWVTDLSQRRVSLFRPNGTLVRTTSAGTTIPYGMTSLGGIVSLQIPQEWGTASEPPYPRFLHLVLAPPAGSVRSMTVLAMQNPRLDVAILVGGRSGRLKGEQPLSDDPLFRVARNGSAIIVVERRAAAGTPTATYSVTRFGPLGEKVFSRSYSYTPTHIDAAMIQEAIDGVRQIQPPRGARVDIDEKEVRRALYVPAAQVPVEKLAVTKDGTIWLRSPSAPGAKVADHTLLGPKGDVTAIVSVPKGEEVMESDGVTVWTKAHTEDGTPVLRWYRIVKPAK